MEPKETGARGLPIAGLFFLLLVVTVYADPLFFRRNFAGRDLAVYNLPMKKAVPVILVLVTAFFAIRRRRGR